MIPRSPSSLLVAAAFALSMCACGRTGLLEPEETSSTTTTPTPQRPTAPQIAAARDRSCAVLRDGTVRCWGGDASGDLDASCSGEGGDPVNGDEKVCASPVVIADLSDVASVTLGGKHSCALRNDGTVWCWGSNSNGQLGDGTGIDHNAPAQVSGLADVRQIVAGERHTCALLGDGTVRCWGENDKAQVGDGSTTDRTVPALVAVQGVVEIAASWDASCARLSNSTAVCWGDNGNTGGPLGPWWRCTHFSTAGDSICPTPTQVPNVFGLTGITASGFGVTGAGTLLDWSDPTFALNTPGLATSRSDFGLVAQFSGNWTGRKRCALDRDGSVWCQDAVIFAPWPAPTAVLGANNAVQIAVGETHACLLAADDSVACWGTNATGQLGDGTTKDHALPIPVSFD